MWTESVVFSYVWGFLQVFVSFHKQKNAMKQEFLKRVKRVLKTLWSFPSEEI